MRRFVSIFLSILISVSFLSCPLSFAVAPAVEGVVLAVELGASILQGYAAWRQLHPNSPQSDYPGYTGGVTIDDDGFSGGSGTIDDGFTGYSGKFGSNGDKSFNDFDSAYQDYVSDLPATEYNSDGSIIWTPSFYLSGVYFNNNYSYPEHSGSFNITNSHGNMGFISNVEYYRLRDNISFYIYSGSFPISGNYSLIENLTCQYYCQGFLSNVIQSYQIWNVSSVYPDYVQDYQISLPGLYFKDSSFYWSFCCRGGNESNNDSPFLINNTTGFFTFTDPVFKIIPYVQDSDTQSVVNNYYNDNSRTTNLSGNLGILDLDGSLTVLDPDLKIVNEHDTKNIDSTTNEPGPTYTNPETGITYPVQDWTYDYSDRSYTLHLDTTNVEEGDTIGDTVVVTYGDENITIQEDHITNEGGTEIHTTETTNVYYIIENPESQDPDDPGTVVDPGGSGSGLATQIGVNIAAGAFAYTNSGSGDFYSYVNISNGGTTTNNNTYNYYGSHDPTSDPGTQTDPSGPGQSDPGTEIAPHTHQYDLEIHEATCIEDGYKSLVCEICGESEIVSHTSAYGHDWTGPFINGETAWLEGPPVGTQGESSSSIFYVCDRCGFVYIVPSMDSPPPPENYNPDKSLQGLSIVAPFSELAAFFNNLIAEVSGMATNFTNFLVVVFPFLPTEFITILELGFVLFIAAGIIRYFLR